MRRTLAARALLLASAIAASAPVVHAQEAASAAPQAAPTDDDLIAQGIALRKGGRDAEALAAFERAYALRVSSRVVAQIALAHQALGDWVDAERGLIEALGDSVDPWIARQRAYLEEGLASVQAHLAWLDVESNIAGAEVRVDGSLRGHLPLEHPIRVASGDVTVEVRAPGYAAIQRTLPVDPSSRVHAVFTLAEQPPVFAQPRDQRQEAAFAPVNANPSSARSAGRVALGGTAALLLIGTAGFVTREWEARIFDGDGCAPTASQSRADRCSTHRDIGHAARTIGIVAFAGSAVALAVSGVLLLGSSRSQPAPKTGHVGCRLTGAAFDCVATF